MPSEQLSLFSLHTVLVPGATLGLRIFEPRYLDLIRDCSRHERGFGVCLILQGEEVGGPASAAAYGTEAVIEDFGSGDDGLLTLQVRGRRRFLVQRVRVRDNGLQVADVAWCEDEDPAPIRPEHALLASLLQQVFEHVGGEQANTPARRFDDAVWVGWRWAELLPMADEQRQALLQTDDPHERLQQVLALLP